MQKLNNKEFKRLAAMAYDRWGLHLPDKKRPVVESRLLGLARRSGHRSLDDCLDSLGEHSSPEELLRLFDALSTNTTQFFRDPLHFDYLEREFFTPLTRKTLTLPNKRIRIWSAACSTGCEPYSLGITATESMPDLAKWDLKILATDLSNTALAAAREGTYKTDQIETMSAERRRRFFGKLDPQTDRHEIKPSVRELVTLRQLNLNGEWPVRGPFHVIFCCNVMIYFDPPTRKRLVQRFYDILAPGGIFAVGGAETINNLGVPFTPVQTNVYVK